MSASKFSSFKLDSIILNQLAITFQDAYGYRGAISDFVSPSLFSSVQLSLPEPFPRSWKGPTVSELLCTSSAVSSTMS
jgi:hypothetical protein